MLGDTYGSLYSGQKEGEVIKDGSSISRTF